MGFVIATCYTTMLKNYAIPELLQQNALNDIVWIQDVAPPQILKSVRISEAS